MAHGNVNDYQINEDDFNNGICLREGANGTVFRGKHKRTGEPVAIKVLREPPKNIQEIYILQNIKHESIVALLAAGTMKKGVARNRFVHILEMGSHEQLDQFLENKAPNGLNDETFLELLECISSAYECLHEHNILHPNIQPSHILVNEEKDGKLCFKLDDSTIIRQTTNVGLKWKPKEYNNSKTPLYWHPRVLVTLTEQPSTSSAAADNTSIDLWMIGMTLYEAATGRKAFQPIIGKRNKKEMKNALQQAYNLMDAGVISMKEKPDGEWEQSTQLPEGIPMSSGLAHLMTPLIANSLSKFRDQNKSLMFSLGYVEAVRNSRDALAKIEENTQWKREKARIEEEERHCKEEIQSIRNKINELAAQNQSLIDERPEKELQMKEIIERNNQLLLEIEALNQQLNDINPRFQASPSGA